MCSAEHGPLKWMGSLQKNTTQLPSEASWSKRDDSPPADSDVRTLCVHWIGSCWICTLVYATEHFLQRVKWKKLKLSVPQWEHPFVLRALSFKPIDGIFLKLQCFEPVLFLFWLLQNESRTGQSTWAVCSFKRTEVMLHFYLWVKTLHVLFEVEDGAA